MQCGDLLCCADEVNAVVVDVGSHTVKAGFAGEDTPKALFPSVSVLKIEQMDTCPSGPAQGDLVTSYAFYIGYRFGAKWNWEWCSAHGH